MTTAVRPRWQPQTTPNACVPTTVAMLCGASPYAVTMAADVLGIWDPESGQDHRTIPTLAEVYGVHVGTWRAWRRTSRPAPGVYVIGALGHCCAVIVWPDMTTATVLDGRNAGPTILPLSDVLSLNPLAAPVSMSN